jgi:3',5'-nucleoside bisphosphate phosphatase
MNRTMRSRVVVVSLLGVVLLAGGLWGQSRQEIQIPDILGYKTLKCDFHMHTVFSDGSVWPTVRVDEAWREGLDAISITDHIEYQPHKEDVPTNHNRPYEIALPRAKERGILLVRGTEITRATPPGHFNAIFLHDINPVDTKDLLEAMAAASKQGAFIFWNHPGWKPEKKGWFDIHTTLYEKKYMRGIEVVNGGSYYPEAHDWALEKNLTFMGNSDIHSPSMLERTTSEKHRTMTLVFAKEKSLGAVKEALFAGRTVAWYQDQLIGRQEYLEALFASSTAVTDIEYGKDTVRFRLRNTSDIDLVLDRTGQKGPKSVELPGGATVVVKTKVADVEAPVEFAYTVQNFIVGPGKSLPVSLTIPGQMSIEIGVEIEER